MAYDITSSMSASAKFSPGQTVGRVKDAGGTSASIVYMPYEVEKHLTIGTTATAQNTAGYSYSIRPRRGTGNPLVVNESAIVSWPSWTALAAIYASTMVSVPTT